MSVLACALDGGGPAHTCGAAGREHEQRHSARRRRMDVRCVRPSKRNIELGSCGNMSYEGMKVGGMERLVREKSDRRGVFIRYSRAKPATRISDARRIVDSYAIFFCPPLQGTTGLPHGVAVTRPRPRPRQLSTAHTSHNSEASCRRRARPAICRRDTQSPISRILYRCCDKHVPTLQLRDAACPPSRAPKTVVERDLGSLVLTKRNRQGGL